MIKKKLSTRFQFEYTGLIGKTDLLLIPSMVLQDLFEDTQGIQESDLVFAFIAS